MSRWRSFGAVCSRFRSLRLEALETRWLLTASNIARLVLPPQQQLLDLTDGVLSSPSQDDPALIAQQYVRDHAKSLGLDAADLSGMRLTDRYTDSGSGITHLYYTQTYLGLRVANTSLNINVTRLGEVINVGSSFVPKIADAVQTSTLAVGLNEVGAIAALGEALKIDPGEIAARGPSVLSEWGVTTTLVATPISQDDIPVTHIWALESDGTVRRAYDLIARTTDGDHWYNVGIDSTSGDILYAVDWSSGLDDHEDSPAVAVAPTLTASTATSSLIDGSSYFVYAGPVEAPTDGSRTLVIDPADPIASPYGWHDTNGVIGPEFLDTRGNNVLAQEDTDKNDTGGSRPSGTASLLFNFAIDFAQAPSSYQSAVITNLFYWNNVLHDIHYNYGFTEAAGNFQTNNYGRGGAGDDAVRADAQDGEGTNNANFSTPPDGFAPRMQQYIFTYTTPNRDSSLDNQIIVHEYGHGVSTRLTGGPANSNSLDALQSGGMGEGWSDWWGLMFTQKSTDTKLGSYGIGTYVLGQPLSGDGIREYPYSFDMAINPHTYGDYNSTQQVHDTGEIWASALWDLNWLLIDKYGFNQNIQDGYAGSTSAGNLLALQLVMDGLKLQPANPSFLDARDAILLADEHLTGGDNKVQIWTAFARRGMGLSAYDGGSADAVFVTEAFDTPVFNLVVASTTPAVDGLVSVAPTSFAVDFTDNYLASSVQPSDFRVNGIAANSVVLTDADTVTFQYTSTPVTTQGTQTMTIAADAILRASDSDGIMAFSGNFTYDVVALQVNGSSPANNATVALPFSTLQLDFNEPIQFASVLNGDLTVSQGTVTGVTLVDADSIRFTISGVTAEGLYTFSLAAGAINDQFGNPGQAYAGSFSIDGGTAPIPPLQSVSPAGSMIYTASLVGTISPGGDVDSFTLNVDAGQTISAALVPTTANLQPTITLRDPTGAVVRTNTANAAGVGVMLAPASVNVAGTYTIDITGAAGTTGAASLKVYLNSSLEPASFLGTSSTTFLSIEASSVPITPGASRLAVIGELPASVSAAATIHATDVPKPIPDLATTLSTIVFTDSSTIADLDVTLDLDHTYDGDLRLSLISPLGTTVILSNRHGGSGENYNNTIFDDEATTPIMASSPPYTGRFRPDESLARFDGETLAGTWTLRIQDLAAIDIGTLNSWSMTVQSPVLPPADGYIFALNQGDLLSAVVDSNAAFDLEVRDLPGVLYASGSSAGVYADAIVNFVAPTTGSYQLVVRSTGATATYRVVATRNAAIELEPNDQRNSAQSIDPTKVVLGRITTSDDYYSFALTAGQQVEITTSIPGQGSGEYVNNLDPRLELYGTSATVLASDDNSALDGRNARLTYTAAQAGTYRVRVQGMNSTQGDYGLQVKNVGVGGTPIVANVQTAEDTLSALIPFQAASNSPFTTAYFQVGDITGGMLLLGDGVTPITAGTYLTLATATTGVRFRPTPNSTTAGSFKVQAATIATSTGLFGAIKTVTVNVTAVNDPPSLTVPGAQLVAQNGSFPLTGVNLTDLDATTASLTLTAAHGILTVNTSVEPGVSAGNVVGNGASSVTITATLASLNALLASTQGVLYTPGNNYVGTDLCSLQLNDLGNTGSGGPMVADATVTVLVYDPLVNDAPWLDPTKHPLLTPVAQGDTDPDGMLIADLLTSPSGAGTLIDPDANPQQGIAIVGVDTSAGSWEFSLNNGTNWQPVGTPTTSAALLLAADANTRVRFLPNVTYWGFLSNAITFRGWDQTSGTNGTTADTSTSGGSTAFSFATTTAQQAVTSPNFSLDGTTLTITGNAGDDRLSYTVIAGNQFSLNLNGMNYLLSNTVATHIQFDGGTGHDVVYFNSDPNQAEHGVFGPGTLLFTSPNYWFDILKANVIVAYGDASDSQEFIGSDGDEVFYGFPAAAIMSTGPLVTTTVGFGSTVVQDSPGKDAAVLFDTAGDDTFVGRPDQSTFTGTGLDMQVDGFNLIYVFSTGGNDVADLHGSTGNDVFYGLDVYSVLADSQLSSFFYEPIGFPTVRGYDSSEKVSGFDIAVFYDSLDDDHLTTSSLRTVQTATDYSTEVNGFDFVYALASQIDRGNDEATFLDSGGNDYLYAQSFGVAPNRLEILSFFSQGAVVQVVNYDRVTAHSTSGSDTVDRQTLAADYALELDARWIDV